MNNDFRVFFVVGHVPDNPEVTRRMREESRAYSDLVTGDFTESFYNNSWKLEMMFEYAHKHCHADFLLKVDDDNFVNMPNLFRIIGRLGTKKLYLGRRLYASWTSRDGKYRMTYDEYTVPILPSFIGGGAVLISRELVKDMIPYLFLGERKPPLKLEDLYTAYLALNAGTTATDNPLFNINTNGRCGYDDRPVSLHFQGAERDNIVECMGKMFDRMKSQRRNDAFVKTHYARAPS